jgi:hypothetical protein
MKQGLEPLLLTPPNKRAGRKVCISAIDAWFLAIQES